MKRQAKLAIGLVIAGAFCFDTFCLQADVVTNAPDSAASDARTTTQIPEAPAVNKSIESLRKKAEAGDAESQFNLGLDYDKGYGVHEDAVEAVKWYRKAADQGDAKAQINLGYSYLFGKGIKKDVVEAFSWIQKASEQGDAASQFVLGLCYESGWGVQSDFKKAANCFRKAADQGDASAQDRLGYCYAKGLGVEVDPFEAVKLFQKSADLGNPDAQYNLGVCYANGIGIEKNSVEAVKWCMKAAYQGKPKAQGLLSTFFLQGRGTIKNEVEGLAWLYVASANGDENAATFIVSEESFISSEEKHNGEEVISEARLRATELQGQIIRPPLQTDSDSANDAISLAKTLNAPRESGSGAFISADGLVLTAAHVVQGASRIEVVTSAGSLVAKLVKIDATNDVALLKCSGSNFSPLPIASSKEARTGATVFTVGFPNIQLQGFDPKLTKGEISSETGFQDDPRQWQISVPIQPGNSGGPLCDENGNLIGIVEATLDPLAMAKMASEIPQNVNYAVKSSYILPLLDEVQNLPPPLVSSNGAKFEDVVANTQKSVVLILVY